MSQETGEKNKSVGFEMISHDKGNFLGEGVEEPI
jgi:hypothetical protein